MDFRDRYSLEKDVECLQNDGKIILARTVAVKGWAILWYDKQGYTVTETSKTTRSVGAALPFEEAFTRYCEALRRLV